MSDKGLTEGVIREAMYVHTTLGPGLLESVYEHCLIKRLQGADYTVEAQKSFPVVFDGECLPQCFRCDIIVEGKVIVEIKATDGISDIHKAQLLTYLKLSNIQVGLILNFNEAHLRNGIKRMML